jgi:hypothetical protein
MPRLRPAASSLLLTCVLLLGSARAAHACVWNPAHDFLPFPPCKVEDQKAFQRAVQTNVWIAGKLSVTAMKIMEVKREIEAWQRAYGEARAWEEQLRRVYGELNTNPLNSMVAEYNRTTRFALYAPLQRDALGRLEFRLLDVGAAADSIFQALGDTTDLRRMWGTAWTPALKGSANRVALNSEMLERQMVSLMDHRMVTRAVSDSLQAVGNRTAARYEGDTGTEGNAEAQITNMSATLTRLRGTTFEAQAEAVNARMRTLSEGRRTSEAAATRNAAHQSLLRMR